TNNTFIMKLKYTKVATLAATLITFGSLAGGANAAIVNGTFDDGLTGWTTTGASGFSAGTNTFPGGNTGARIFNSNTQTVGPNEFREFSQTVDLTAITTLSFDISTRYNGFGNAWDASRFVASVTIDGVDQITFSTTDVQLGVEIDVSSLSGDHDLGFRLTSLMTTVGTGSGVVTHQFVFDNVTAVPEPSSALLLGFGALSFAARRRRN
ncbi:PEP-CTERM sorting domain-containing protein, partial [Akkermansiaceae bacterium]|nr:PEP-CTERM sorting domain-containing protein [Akkermansiaceae bacterium]